MVEVVEVVEEEVGSLQFHEQDHGAVAKKDVFYVSK